MDQAGTSLAGAPKRKGVDFWMIAAIVAIVRADRRVPRLHVQAAGRRLAGGGRRDRGQTRGGRCRAPEPGGIRRGRLRAADLRPDRGPGAAETQGGISEAQLQEAQQQLAETQAELESTSGELDDAEQELAATQAELDDANAKLEQLGELVLPNGTYVGPVLGARAEPIPAIVFQDGTAWRVAEVAPDVAITAGGQEMTLEEFSALLQSTDPADVELANGPYEVVVKKGLVTTIRTAET